MRGLLIKDFYNIWKQGLWYAAMIAMFCGISVIAENPAFSATIGILASASVPLTAIAYEEKDGWQKFAAAGGLSAGTVVAEKYLLGILFALPARSATASRLPSWAPRQRRRNLRRPSACSCLPRPPSFP